MSGRDRPGDGTAGALKRGLQVAAITLVAALLGLLFWRMVTDRGGEFVSAVRAGERPRAPAFELPVIWPRAEMWPLAARSALRDGRVSLDELRGHPVVLNFWASWCTPCRAEAPILEDATRTHRGEVVFLGVDVQDFVGDARKFLSRYRVSYVSVRDGDGGTNSSYGVTGLPETFYLDRDGRVVAQSVGQLTREELERGVAAAKSDG